MTTYVSYARRLWFPYGGRFGRRVKMPPPRLVQLCRRVACAVRGHDWGRWRIETEDWFKYVDEPEPYAMRSCQRRCGAMEHAR